MLISIETHITDFSGGPDPLSPSGSAHGIHKRSTSLKRSLRAFNFSRLSFFKICLVYIVIIMASIACHLFRTFENKKLYVVQTYEKYQRSVSSRSKGMVNVTCHNTLTNTDMLTYV